MKTRIFSLLFMGALGAPAAHAVDKDDFYANLYGGARFDSRIQGGVALGYAPVNSVGIGLLLDGTRSTAQASIESRWFLEPFELAGGLGFSRDYDANNDGKAHFLVSLAAAYLWALTPSLALRAELRGQYLVNATSSALLSLGGRIVF